MPVNSCDSNCSSISLEDKKKCLPKTCNQIWKSRFESENEEFGKKVRNIVKNDGRSDVSQDGGKEYEENAELRKLSYVNEEVRGLRPERRSEESQSIRNNKRSEESQSIRNSRNDAQKSRKSDCEIEKSLIRNIKKIGGSCEKHWKFPSQSELVELFERVYPSGVPNFRGCRIPLPHNKMNIPLWRHWLEDYGDKIVCEFLEFGFPLDFNKCVELNTDERRNHNGARDHPDFVNQYLRKEVDKFRIAGPFQCSPCQFPSWSRH